MIGGAILPSLLHQDPRYFYQRTGTTGSRMRHAVLSAFIAKGHNGKWQPNYSTLVEIWHQPGFQTCTTPSPIGVLGSCSATLRLGLRNPSAPIWPKSSFLPGSPEEAVTLKAAIRRNSPSSERVRLTMTKRSPNSKPPRQPSHVLDVRAAARNSTRSSKSTSTTIESGFAEGFAGTTAGSFPGTLPPLKVPWGWRHIRKHKY
jgi:hypothetical protein